LGNIDHTLFYNGNWPALTLLLFLVFAPFMLMLFLNVITALMAAVMNTNREVAVQQYLHGRAVWACWQDHHEEAFNRLWQRCFPCTRKRGRFRGYLHWLTPVSVSGASTAVVEERERGLQEEVEWLRKCQEQQTAEMQALRTDAAEMKALLLQVIERNQVP
jgi:hypothetical protein